MSIEEKQVLQTKPKYDFVVYIGRFSPLHSGHMKTIERAFSQGKHVIILIGSSFQARTLKNPWSWTEREKMIRDSFFDRMIPKGGDANGRMTIVPLRDYLYNDQQWFADVQNQVSKISNDNQNIAIIGHDKDHSSYYLKHFPQWNFINVEHIDGLNATDIRNPFFKTGVIAAPHHFVPEPVFNFLNEFKKTENYSSLCNEYSFVEKYKQQFSGLKYPPIFVTADAVVIQSGHVLLVKRKAFPGKGLFALPGGFLRENERIIDCMIHELKEETKLKVPAAVLKGSIVKNSVFDAPERSSRGRTITHAWLIELEAGELPKVKGSDDAEKAFWMPLGDALNNSELFFEDHHSIISYFLGVL